MPTLEWIGKDKVINHHQEVPFRVLECQYSYGAQGQRQDDKDSQNMIIRGDNLEALKALLPRYEGQIKCIYIDPPYNTGNEGWVYNDNVNDPKIKKWLGQVVGKEGEDLSRHDKWLCMMYPRLRLLHRLLANDGAIFISIDDVEVANLRFILEEIFGLSNFIACIVWQKAKKGDAKLVSTSHEYVLVAAKSKATLIRNGIVWRKHKQGIDAVLDKYDELRQKHKQNHEPISKDIKKWYNELPKNSPSRAHKHYNCSDDRGLYFAADFAGPDDGRKNRPRYDIIHPVTGLPCKKPSTGWRWDEQRTKEALGEIPPRIHFGLDHTTIPCRKSYLVDVSEESYNSVFYKDGRSATLLLERIIGRGKFEFPKDVDILSELIEMVTKKDSVVLDSFAGSGTTAHAVLNLNKQDGGNRQFILVEMEDYAESITAERVKRVINGYDDVEGTGGDFNFYDLGEPLMIDAGHLNEAVGVEKIREYVWYMETRKPFTSVDNGNPYYLGTSNDTAYYFFYELTEITTLDYAFLSTIKVKLSGVVIYADRCSLSEEELLRLGIVFKKIPRDIAKL